jgi:hypothetical protein
MKYKLKKILIIIPIGLFLFFSILFLFLLKETKKNVEISKQAEINIQEETLAREEAKEFNNFFASIEKEKALFETHFVQNSDVVPFLNAIEKIAGSVGVKAEVSLIEVAKDNTGLILGMKSEGNFEQIYKFLLLLENSPYELEFISVEMHSSSIGDIENLEENKNETKKNQWEAIFKIKLLSFV